MFNGAELRVLFTIVLVNSLHGMCCSHIAQPSELMLPAIPFRIKILHRVNQHRVRSDKFLLGLDLIFDLYNAQRTRYVQSLFTRCT